MERLRAIGREALEDFGRLLDHPNTTGLLIETDPDLRALWQIRAGMSRRDWDAVDRWLVDNPQAWPSNGAEPWWGVGGGRFAGQPTGAQTPQRALPCDPWWTCFAFDRIVHARPWGRHENGRPAVIFTLVYEPSISRGAFEELSAMAADLPWVTRLAARPVARAQAGARAVHSPVIGGISIGDQGSHTTGTLGGVLVLDGVEYGVTCGHVIDGSGSAVQPAHRDGGVALIGDCRHSTDGALTGVGSSCRGRGRANVTDAALVRLKVAAAQKVRKIGTVRRAVPLADVVEGEAVQVSARSGLRTLEIGALALRRSITIGGSLYCFEDLFELRRPGAHWGAAGSVKPPTRGGDSGAWVVRSTAGRHEWVGMVTAGDGPVSYAQFAETVEAWATAEVTAASGASPTP